VSDEDTEAMIFHKVRWFSDAGLLNSTSAQYGF
jgi:hypothetical protein